MAAELPSDVSRWTNEDCAAFVADVVGLPQYAETFETNLNGYRITRLDAGGLTKMNVRDFAHQRKIMAELRRLRGDETAEAK